MVKNSSSDQIRRSMPCWLFLLAILVQGCATLNESECQNADWRTIGYEDGAMGAAASRIGKHREACARHHISPDLQAYRQGREEGLRQFCRPANGFRLGERGSGYAGVCPPDIEPEFLSAYESGKHIHDIVADIRSTERSLQIKEQELVNLEDRRQSRQAELIGGDVSTGRRAELLLEVFELSRDQGTMESEISLLEAELEQKRGTLVNARAANLYKQ